MSERLPPCDDRDWAETEQVMSEVHLGCPPGISGPYISRFTFPIPLAVEYFGGRSKELVADETDSIHQVICSDVDGDLVLPRRDKQPARIFHAIIQHSITSTIPGVGLQVWRAELVLADFVLHMMFTSSEFTGVISLELGAGTGLVGILLAQVAETVFLTDHGDAILENCAKNVMLNSATFTEKASIYVRELDWKKAWPPMIDLNHSLPHKRYCWTEQDIEKVHRASLLLAADVIYSDDLTDAFFSTLEQLMTHGSEKVLYLALEKRYNFSLDDLEVVANGYSHFRSYIRDDNGWREPGGASWPCFVGKRVDLTQVPHYIQEYDCGNDIEIWQIKYLK